MPEEKAPESNPLIFHWTIPVWKQRGLFFWMFVVLLGLAAFFYLFQVVYPQAQRFTPVPHQIVVLNPTDPAAKELMNRVHDRDFLILPPPSESTSTVSLEDHVPVFHPTFEGHKLQLQDLPSKTFTVPPARLLQMDEPVLPPPDFTDLKASPIPTVKTVTVTPSLVLRLSGPLSLRGVKRTADLSGITLADPTNCRFQLGVNADGGVDVALPLSSGEDAATIARLTAAMQSIRFAPASAQASAPVWGTVTFEWSKGGAP